MKSTYLLGLLLTFSSIASVRDLPRQWPKTLEELRFSDTETAASVFQPAQQKELALFSNFSDKPLELFRVVGHDINGDGELEYFVETLEGGNGGLIVDLFEVKNGRLRFVQQFFTHRVSFGRKVNGYKQIITNWSSNAVSGGQRVYQFKGLKYQCVMQRDYGPISDFSNVIKTSTARKCKN